MRKALAVLMALCLIFAVVSCSGKSASGTSGTTGAQAAAAATTTTTTTTTTAAAEAVKEAEPVKAEESATFSAAKTETASLKTKGEYKLGMGIVYSDNHTDEQAAYDAVCAVVVTDSEGRIVECRIDDAQNKMNTDAIESSKEFRSKKELEFDYNMVKYSEAQYEWFEQVAAFEKYVVGKTAEEVSAIETRVRTADEPHPGYVVAADETLFAQCSIQITEFKEAVVKACSDSKAQTFTSTDGSFSLGLKLESTAEETTAPTDEKDGTIKMYVDFGAAVVDKNGVILACLTDAIQPAFTVDSDLEITSSSYKGTKKELEYDYNMVKYSEAEYEWFEQAKAFEDYCVGKTGEEVASLPTRVRTDAEPHPGYVVTTDETLFAQCSIQITSFKSVISKAAENAAGEKSEETYSLGMGIVYSDNHTDEQAAYDAVCAVVVTDSEGRIVECRIDDAQNKMNTDAIESSKEFRSKKELEFDYNMVKYSEAQYEWFEQVAAFEKYVVGKTAEEVSAIETRVRTADEPHPGYVVAADETLFAQCSIQITEFKEAVVKACSDSKAQTFTSTDGSFSLGLKLESTAEETTAPTDEKDGTIKMYVDFGAAVVDKNGVILACLTDAIQPAFTVDSDLEITSSSYKGTKKELEYDYNMVKYSEAEYEWFEQAKAFEDYCVGKTGEEVASLPTRVRTDAEPHPGYVVTTDETLFAQCSIQITSFKSVISKAAENAD